MKTTRLAWTALSLGLLAAPPALAWDPVPNRPARYTAVVRVLDTAVIPNEQRGLVDVVVALSEAPGDFCTQLGAAGRTPSRDPLPTFSPAWIGVWLEPSVFLAQFMAARAQNLPVRVIMYAGRGTPCYIEEVRTCTDAVACAVPGLPGN